MNEAARVFRERLDNLLPALADSGGNPLMQLGVYPTKDCDPDQWPAVDLDSKQLGEALGKIILTLPPGIRKETAYLHATMTRCLLTILPNRKRLPIYRSIGTEPGYVARVFTAGFALSAVRDGADSLALATAENMQAIIEAAVTDEPMRVALWGRRADLARRWPWTLLTLEGISVTLLLLLAAEDKHPAIMTEIEMMGLSLWDPKGVDSAQALAAMRLLTGAIRDIEAARHRPMMAVDAGKPHHALLMGLRDLPKDRRERTKTRKLECGRIEIIRPGPVQLALPLDLDDGLHEATIKALRKKEVGGWYGLRTWAALLRLLSVEGGRGPVVWTMDRHIEALGYEPSVGRRLCVRERVERTINALTALELAVYDTSGGLRERAPLVVVYSRKERQTRGRWRLEEARIGVNPLLYSGVRRIAANGDPGRLGSNWYPAPVELAKVNHNLHPYALSLGLLLPIRWHLAMAEGRDALRYKGSSLLRLAGIPAKRDGRWEALRRDLDELNRIGLLGNYRWDSDPWSNAGICILEPAQWMLDRTVRGIKPLELPPVVIPRTGAELRTWRTDRKLTQTAAANRLGISRPTIARIESRPDDPVTQSVIKAFENGRGA